MAELDIKKAEELEEEIRLRASNTCHWAIFG